MDLVFHGSNQRQLEYDFVVGRGGDPGVIRLGFEGTERLVLDAAGDLVLSTAGGDVTWRAPVAYQDVDGARRPVAARYEVRSRREVGFRVAAYDRDRPLVIDPVLAWTHTSWPDPVLGREQQRSGHAARVVTVLIALPRRRGLTSPPLLSAAPRR